MFVRTITFVLATATFIGFIAGSTTAEPSKAAPTTAPTAQVTIDNFSFSPAVLTISVGDQVTWVNHDDVPHTVLSNKPDRTIKSDALDTDQTYSHTFTAPGTYDYFCTIHPHMTGKIIVKSH